MCKGCEINRPEASFATVLNIVHHEIGVDLSVIELAESLRSYKASQTTWLAAIILYKTYKISVGDVVAYLCCLHISHCHVAPK